MKSLFFLIMSLGISGIMVGITDIQACTAYENCDKIEVVAEQPISNSTDTPKYVDDCASVQPPSVGPEELKKFEFSADGLNSYAIVHGDPASEIVSLTLDKDAKKLVFVGKYKTDGESNGRIPFIIIIPSELLGSDIIIQNDQNASMTLSAGKYWDEINNQSISNSGDNHWNSWLHANKYHCFTVVQYMWYKAGIHRLDITGTTVIPEFSFAGTILVVSVGLLVALYRIKITK